MMLVRSDRTAVERRTQGRGLSAPGRSDDENHPVLMTEEQAHLFERHRRHADFLEHRHAFAVIEHAHDDLLAEERAKRRHAKVDFRAIVGHRAQPAVLRQPLLGDVHAGHDLQPGNQAFVDPLGQVHHFLQQPVEAMPDEHAFLHGLDMDVARAALDRAADDQVDEIDDRRSLAYVSAAVAGCSKMSASSERRARAVSTGDGSPATRARAPWPAIVRSEPAGFTRTSALSG